MSAILLADSSGRPCDPSFFAAAGAVTAGSGVGIAAAQQSPIRGHINPMIDLQEIDMAVIELIKEASRFGMSLETAAGSPGEEPAPVDGPWARTMFRPSSPAPAGAATDAPDRLFGAGWDLLEEGRDCWIQGL